MKELREVRGLTQQQLADAAGMNKFGLAKLEQGVTEPYWPTVLKLASAMGVNCMDFGGLLPEASVEPEPEVKPAKKRVKK